MMVGGCVQTVPAHSLKTGSLLFILRTTKGEKMRIGRTLVLFIGLTVMLLSEELWLIRGLAAQESRNCFCNLEIRQF